MSLGPSCWRFFFATNETSPDEKERKETQILISILVKGGEEAAIEVAAKVKVFTRATSFGGTHSLIEHRASVEAEGSKTPRNLLRLSIGLEHLDDLRADLKQALA